MNAVMSLMTAPVPPITDQEFDDLKALVKKEIGIHLTAEKRQLLSGRLQKRIRELRLNSYGEYYCFVMADREGQELARLASLISTNHTFFLRENGHFDFLTRKALPEIAAKINAGGGKKELRVWCAASSTGEEPYTLAMLLMEYFGEDYARWDAGLLATDISTRALDLAKAGVYEPEKVACLPPLWIQKYLFKRPDGHFEFTARVKREVLYRRFNLTSEKFPFAKPFHIIFCRNVMIYFDAPTKEALIQKLWENLEPGGFLFLGHSETLGLRRQGFRSVQASVYQKVVSA